MKRIAGSPHSPTIGRRLMLFCLAAGLAITLPAVEPRLAGEASAADGGVLERIAETGVMRAGTRGSSPPFARTLPSGGFEGFSVDLLEEVRAAVEQTVGRAVALELFEVTPSDRLERVAAGELDIVCGITTPTWDREALVDFSLPFFRDGTRILVYRELAASGTDLGRLKIGVVENTTTEGIVKDRLPTAELHLYASMDDAMRGLGEGEVQGVANIGISLMALAESAEPRRSVVLLPRTRVLAVEALACVLPQNDSAWRDAVNRTLVALFADVEDFRSRYDQIYERWFGRGAEIFYPLDRGGRDYLGSLSIWVR